MKHVDLFSGIGGFALAAQWAGYETVLFCDNDPYCQKVLRKHWPNVPVIGDIRDVNEETVANAYGAGSWRESGNTLHEGRATRKGRRTGISQDAERRARVAVADYQPADTDGRPTTGLPTIDLLTGGFPCQPFSVAGKRGGEADNRFLWPEMLRVISLFKPTWVLAENVGGILTIDNGLVIERVLSDLEGEGYEVQPFVIPACAVNAPHRRDRVWIVAHATSSGLGTGGSNQRGRQVCDLAIGTATENQPERSGRQLRTSSGSGREDVADTARELPHRGRRTRNGRTQPTDGSATADAEGPRLEGADTAGDSCTTGRTAEYGQRGRQADWWAVEPRMGDLVDGLPAALDGHWDREPDIPRVAVGVKDRVNRLRGLGNAIVPQVAYQVMCAIREAQ